MRISLSDSGLLSVKLYNGILLGSMFNILSFCVSQYMILLAKIRLPLLFFSFLFDKIVDVPITTILLLKPDYFKLSTGSDIVITGRGPFMSRRAFFSGGCFRLDHAVIPHDVLELYINSIDLNLVSEDEIDSIGLILFA